MNNYRFRFNNTEPQKALEVPINLSWDLGGVNDSIDLFESEVIRQVINPIDNFETTRYSHKTYNDTITNKTQTSINYEFYFYSATTDSNITGETTSTNWVTDYRANNMTTTDIVFKVGKFTSSFFKLDFYDTPSTTNQQIYLTVILPTRQGEIMTVPYGITTVDIKKPVYKLDYVGDKEGFFIYWLKNTEFVDLQTLYMSAKFFDASIGQFKRMMTVPQGLMGEKFNFNNEEYFYYQVNVDYTGYTYDVTLSNSTVQDLRVGTTSNPIKWYEYVNPPIPPIPTGVPTPTPTPTPVYKTFQLERCTDSKIMYGTDNSNLGVVVGDFVKISGAANSGCWEVISEVGVGASSSIISKHTDCSCS